MKGEELAQAWRAALDWWSQAIALAVPIPIEDPQGPIAYIDLATRQTHVNFGKLASMGVAEHVPTILAHEVGHHIRYPHTIAEARRMQRFLRELAGELFVRDDAQVVARDRFDWLLNLFFDLLINDELSADHEASFVAIFRAMRGDWSASFAFYIAMFEELWMLAPNTLLPPEAAEALTAIEPAYRGRARAAGEFVRGHPENRPLQLARFLVALRPFVMADGERSSEAFEREPLGGSGALDADAVADLLRRRGDEEEARKWLREHEKNKRVDGVGGGDPLTRANLELQGLVPPAEVALNTYRREADRAPLEIPRRSTPVSRSSPVRTRRGRSATTSTSSTGSSVLCGPAARPSPASTPCCARGSPTTRSRAIGRRRGSSSTWTRRARCPTPPRISATRSSRASCWRGPRRGPGAACGSSSTPRRASAS